MTGKEIFDRINIFNPDIKEEDYIKNPNTGEVLSLDLQKMYYAGKNEESIMLIMDIFDCDKTSATEAYEIFKKFIGAPPSPQQIARANAEARESLNKPHCPTCNSTNIKKISTTSKVVNTAMFGIFGQKRKHQMHCNNCGYEW